MVGRLRNHDTYKENKCNPGPFASLTEPSSCFMVLQYGVVQFRDTLHQKAQGRGVRLGLNSWNSGKTASTMLVFTI